MYQFEVPPALHGSDIEYTFWNGQPSNLWATMAPLVAPLAPVLQGYITNFAMTGNPNGMELPQFPTDGNNATEVGLSATGLNVEINSYEGSHRQSQVFVLGESAVYMNSGGMVAKIANDDGNMPCRCSRYREWDGRQFLQLAPTDSAGHATDTHILPVIGTPVTCRDRQGAAKALHKVDVEVYKCRCLVSQ